MFPHHLGRENLPEVDYYLILDAAEVSGRIKTEKKKVAGSFKNLRVMKTTLKLVLTKKILNP